VVKSSAKLVKRYVLNPALPWEKQRERMDSALMAGRAPKSVVVTTDTIAGIPVEICTPASGAAPATLIHVHGGGFTVGSAATTRSWAAAISAALKIRVISPDYSLAPEHQFPCILDEVGGLVDQVIDSVGAELVALSGDSAGGNLALVSTLRRAQSGAPMPAALILISPWLDLTTDRLDDPALVRRDPLLNPEWLAASAVAYAPGQLDNPMVSPLLGPLEGLPPVLVQGGTDDVLAPDAGRLVAAIESTTSVTYSVGAEMWHDFPLQVGLLAAADSAFEVTTEFLTRNLALGPSV
jgi:acetyl esterase/lipase